MEFVGIVVGGLVLYGIISVFTRMPGWSLESKFAGLGTLSGRTQTEIIEVAGPPTSASVMDDGKMLLQWMAGGYHIALLFDGDICEGVTHEVST